MTFLPSTIIQIKGKNGSGKTSLIRIIAGLQDASFGNITSNNILDDSCIYIGHKLGIKSDLTLLENVTFWLELYNAKELVDVAIKYFNLHEVMDRKCHELSMGMQKRVALTRLMAGGRKLWLLDEPDINLDSENKILLQRLIISHADSGGIVIIASHNQPFSKTVNILDLEDYKSAI